jgi:hypothetical protein
MAKELTPEDRIRLYAAAFPDFPTMWHSKGWILGVWNIGNNYKGSGYHGSYPSSYLKRITSLFPDCKKVLHLFSGSLPEDKRYTRVDIKPELKPEILCDAEELSNHIDPESYDIIYADPPYTNSDALQYGTPMCNRNKVLKECYKILKPGGYVCWMDMVLPMYSKEAFQRIGEISISRSTNHRVRTVFIFQKKK